MRSPPTITPRKAFTTMRTQNVVRTYASARSPCSVASWEAQCIRTVRILHVLCTHNVLLLLIADGGADSDETPGRVNGPRCPWMVDNTRVRQFFRFLALLNLVVLLLSVPFSTVHCAGGNDTSDGDNSPSNLVQLCVITGLDAVLALLFTVQFALRLRYFVAMRRPLKVLSRVATRILGAI